MLSRLVCRHQHFGETSCLHIHGLYLMMELAGSSVTLLSMYQNMQHHILEGCHLNIFTDIRPKLALMAVTVIQRLILPSLVPCDNDCIWLIKSYNNTPQQSNLFPHLSSVPWQLLAVNKRNALASIVYRHFQPSLLCKLYNN
jgi:hypothetical protein